MLRRSELVDQSLNPTATSAAADESLSRVADLRGAGCCVAEEGAGDRL